MRKYIKTLLISVPEHGERFYEDLQLDLHDATHRPLEWLPSIPCANAARISAQLLGCYQRITGQSSKLPGLNLNPFLMDVHL